MHFFYFRTSDDHFKEWLKRQNMMQKNIEKVCIKYESQINTQLDFSMSRNVGLGVELGTFLNRIK